MPYIYIRFAYGQAASFIYLLNFQGFKQMFVQTLSFTYEMNPKSRKIIEETSS